MNKTVLITAGPTHERIDPVRFIGNYSTGKMGFALAEQMAAYGATVILVCGPVNLSLKNPAIHRIDVVTADEMYDVCVQQFPKCQLAVMTAAVADFAPEVTAAEKIKRTEGNLMIALRPNRDIAAALGSMKRSGQRLIGFALENAREMENAQGKLQKKNLDMIVLNSLRDEGAGFGFDTNKITILTSQGKIFNYPLKSKRDVAIDIIDKILELE